MGLSVARASVIASAKRAAIRITLSLRASAHTGVAIRFPLVTSLAPLKGELAAARQTEGMELRRLREKSY